MKKILMIIISLNLFASAYAQESAPLLIGDEAPAIKFSKWLKGTPVNSFEKDKMYVIECWATWCGPCIAAMPHLSELAKKYKDRVTFIGFNVWEKIPDEQPYTTVLPKVTSFVENLGEKMSYNVAVDDDNRYMAKNWLARAKAPGIPTTFLVKDGKFIWIGHPNAVDSIITKVEKGTYDIASYRKGHQASITMSNKAANKERLLIQPIDSAIAAKKYEKAFMLIDKAIAEMPITKYQMNIKKFKTKLDFIGENEALAFAEEWKKKDGDRVGSSIAQAIVLKKNYSKNVYLYAAKEFERGSTSGASVNPMYFDYIATSYALAGEFEKAAAAQQTAIDKSKEALQNGKFTGIILDTTVTDYQSKLTTYQSKIKSKK
jgi:thiol-disulfide isomerase/thioredoxin